MKTWKISTTTTLFLLLTTAELALGNHQISHCKQQSSGCCTACEPKYFVAKCKCLVDDGGIKFFARMNEFIFILIFIFLPMTLVTIFYMRSKAKFYNDLAQRAKIDRRGDPVMFDDKEIHSKLDRITNTRSEVDGPFELEDGRGKELRNPLAEDSDED